MVSVFEHSFLIFSHRASKSPEQGAVDESENDNDFLRLETKFLNEEITEVDEQLPPPIDHVIEVCTLTACPNPKVCNMH